jgi:hypothetical protein
MFSYFTPKFVYLKYLFLNASDVPFVTECKEPHVEEFCLLSLTVAQMFKNFPTFCGTRKLNCLQFVVGYCFKPNESISDPHTPSLIYALLFFHVCTVRRSPKNLSFIFPDSNSVCTVHLFQEHSPVMCLVLCIYIPLAKVLGFARLCSICHP